MLKDQAVSSPSCTNASRIFIPGPMLEKASNSGQSDPRLTFRDSSRMAFGPDLTISPFPTTQLLTHPFGTPRARQIPLFEDSKEEMRAGFAPVSCPEGQRIRMISSIGLVRFRTNRSGISQSSSDTHRALRHSPHRLRKGVKHGFLQKVKKVGGLEHRRTPDQ